MTFFEFLVRELKLRGFYILIALNAPSRKDKEKLIFLSLLSSIPRRVWLYISKDIKKRIFGDPTFCSVKNVTVKIDGLKYRLTDGDSLRVINPQFEHHMHKHLKLKCGDVFMDVGAHIGKYSIPIAKTIRNRGRVIAIEPNPTNFKTLVWNIKENGLNNVIPLNIAAWNKNCKLKLFVADTTASYTVKKDRGYGFITVKARILDDVLKELNVNRVDWVKIDVERAEYEVLKGLNDTIKKHRPKIIVEISKGNEEKIINFMRELGYVFQIVPPMPFDGPRYFFLAPERCF